MAFTKVEPIYPDLWDWDEQPVLIGIYRGAETKNTRYGETKMHYLTPDDGTDQVAFWETATLANLMGQLKPPCRIRVSFEGTEKTDSGNNVKMFSVELDSEWKEEDDIPF